MAAMKTLFDHLIVPVNAKMPTYVSSSYSLSSVMFSYILAHMSRHYPQSVEQPNPALRQEQRRVSHIQSYSYTALHSAARLEQHPCYIPRAAVYPLLLSSQDSVDADVDHALIPSSILHMTGKHGGYGTCQQLVSSG